MPAHAGALLLLWRGMAALYAFAMAKPYGKMKRPVRRTKEPPKQGNEPFKIKLRGKDGAPLSMREVQQGLLETVRKLRWHDDLRAKWATLYLTLIDEDGREVVPDPKGAWELYPYKSAADEHGA